MKLTKFLLIPFLMVSLVSCGVGGTTTTDEPTSPTVPDDTGGGEITDTDQTNWAPDVLTLMDTHLKGNVMPFVEMHDCSWTYSRDLEGLIYDGAVSVSLEEYKAFIEAVKASETLIHLYCDDFYQDMEYINDFFVLPLAQFQTKEEAIFYDAYLKGDDFYIMAYYNILVEEWDGAKVQEEVKRCLGVETLIPAPTTFEVLTFLCQGLGEVPVEQRGVIVTVYGTPESSDAQYIKDLTDSGWVLDEESGTYYDSGQTLRILVSGTPASEDTQNMSILELEIIKF